MSQKLINLTHLWVIDVIDNTLKTKQNQSCLYTTSTFDLRQKLITYVMSRVTNVYIVIEDEQELSIKSDIIYESTGRQLDIATVIEQGIAELLVRGAC